MQIKKGSPVLVLPNKSNSCNNYSSNCLYKQAQQKTPLSLQYNQVQANRKMGFKIRDASNNIKRKKTKERKVVEKYSYSQLSNLSQRFSELADEKTGSISQQLQRQSSNQNQSRRRRNERSPMQKEKHIPLQVNTHTLIGSISYSDKVEDGKSKTKNISQSSVESDKPIEQQVLEYYQEKIDKLDVRQTLKSYLRRTLDTIILSNDSDKIFLLEIRKQLKQSQRIAAKQEYSEFLQLVDNLYLLAVDKYLTQIHGGTIGSRNTTNESNEQNQQSSPSSYAPGLIGEQSTNSPTLTDSILRLQTTNSTEIVRILQRNALQRLAQAYRRVAANNYNNFSRLQNNITTSHTNSFSNALRDNYLNSQLPDRTSTQGNNSSIGSNSRRTNLGSWSTNEDNQHSSPFLLHSTRNNQDDSIPSSNVESNNNNNNYNPITHSNTEGQEDDDDLLLMMRNPLDQLNREQRINSSTSNSSLISFGRGRFIGVRSISNQVTANQGDTSIQTSSETGSNISN